MERPVLIGVQLPLCGATRHQETYRAPALSTSLTAAHEALGLFVACPLTLAPSAGVTWLSTAPVSAGGQDPLSLLAVRRPTAGLLRRHSHKTPSLVL